MFIELNFHDNQTTNDSSNIEYQQEVPALLLPEFYPTDKYDPDCGNWETIFHDCINA